ncbi:MAG: type II secretion system protein [Candidatus Kerfeldbacteria bacterium]|nr:type II secretion system protein [Candidatus Kerfeldbacteria bacterium]
MNRRGFTLVELIISISIFVFLTTVTVFSFRGAGFASSVRSNGAILASTLRRMQSYAISGNSVRVCSDYSSNPRTCETATTCGGVLTCDAVVPTGGFGVAVLSANATAVSIFADLNNDQQYTAARDVLIETQTVNLTDKTRISNGGGFPQVVVFGAQRGKPSFVPANGNAANNTQYFCVSHPNFTGTYRKVIVNGITGSVDDVSQKNCP